MAVPLLEEVIRPSRTLSAAERITTYHGMYFLRMADALAADYPALQHFLGEDGFRKLVRNYVQAHPSRSYSLNRLGDHLPDFLRAATTVRRPEFCHELAPVVPGLGEQRFLPVSFCRQHHDGMRQKLRAAHSRRKNRWFEEAY